MVGRRRWGPVLGLAVAAVASVAGATGAAGAATSTGAGSEDDADPRTGDSDVTALAVPLPEADGNQPPGEPPDAMTVALIFDLRVPVTYAGDATTSMEPTALERSLAVGDRLARRTETDSTVLLNPEIFDALARMGEEVAVDSLRAATTGKEVILAPWTALDISSWLAAGRADVVADGFERARSAFETAGINVGSTIGVAEAPTAADMVWLRDRIGATGIVISGGGAERAEPSPLRPSFVPGPDEEPLMVIEADPVLETLLAQPDAESAVHHFRSELERMATTGTSSGPVVIVSQELGPTVIDLLLDELDSNPLLQPVTVSNLLASSESTRSVSAAGFSPVDLSSHIARRTSVEDRLRAYESFIAPNDTIIASLETLLAASANRDLTTAERSELLDAVTRQVTAGMEGITWMDRGRITIIGDNADLPVTISNGQSLPVRVVLGFSAARINFPHGPRKIVTLEPGRNEITVRVEARASGHSVINVAITTPEGKVLLDEGTAQVRSAGLSGVGLLLIVGAGAILVIWWVRTDRRRRRPVALDSTATVTSSTLEPEKPSWP